MPVTHTEGLAINPCVAGIHARHNELDGVCPVVVLSAPEQAEAYFLSPLVRVAIGVLFFRESKGHPLDATGLAQCYELTHQLRGTAGDRQVEGVRHALQHNLGLGGACVVTLYEKAARSHEAATGRMKPAREWEAEYVTGAGL